MTTTAMRFFNTAGPIVAADHYHVPPLERLDRDEVLMLIRQQKYFVLHAPRQTGKTSSLLALRDLLNSGGAGEYRCVYVNVEAGQAAREDVAAAMRAILGEMALQADYALGDPTLGRTSPETLETVGPYAALHGTLSRWAESDPRPLVLLLDEIDALIGDSLLAVLRQLRAGYPDRPRRFPQSVVLCGVRDVRDYRIRSSSEGAIIAGGSPFNIIAESLRLEDFSRADVESLLRQHTEETGQDLTWTTQEMSIPHDPAWYVEEDGALEVGRLLAAFQEFFREHSEHWVERFQYKEAGPQLLLQAFLQRILNSGGRIEREYGLGRLRTDLLLVWPLPGDAGGVQKVVIECKVLHRGLERTLREGLEQTRAYMDRCGSSEGHLVIFDRTEGKSWEEKIYRRDETEGGAPVTVWGM